MSDQGIERDASGATTITVFGGNRAMAMLVGAWTAWGFLGLATPVGVLVALCWDTGASTDEILGVLPVMLGLTAVAIAFGFFFGRIALRYWKATTCVEIHGRELSVRTGVWVRISRTLGFDEISGLSVDHHGVWWGVSVTTASGPLSLGTGNRERAEFLAEALESRLDLDNRENR